jgi:uncharacterized protein YbaR (Trm112 family)
MDGSSQVPPALLELLRCPETRQRLELLPAEQLAALALPFEAVLIRDDRQVCYPIENGFPILLPERAIRLAPHA